MMKTLKTLFFLLFFVLINSCVKKEFTKKIKIEGPIFGTGYNIIYINDGKVFKKEINNLFDDINQSLSTYISSSDISKINRGEKNIKIDQYFKDVFEISKKVHKETDGYFDPTVGVLVNAWGFGPTKRIKNLERKKIDSLLLFVGFDKVKQENNLIIKENSNIFLDFNSVAKGYAVDVIANFLEEQQIKNYLVEIGGEVRTKGKNDKNEYWKIGIDNPNFDGSRTISKLISLKNESVAGSGNYRKFKIDSLGKKYVHTINPKTGLAKESNLLAATVFGEMSCAIADAYATAFMAMGLEKTQLFLEKHKNIKVILFYQDNQNNLSTYTNYTYN